MKRPAELRHRVAIEAPSRAGDGAGGATISWTPIATVWADVASFKGSKLLAADQIEEHEPFRVVIRYRAGMKAEMRIVWRGRRLDIVSIFDPDGERRWLVLECEERSR